MSLPADYLERVYAGVLGKIIGVYLGRPFEGWGYDTIHQKLGEVSYYVHDKLGQPLVVTDDDISGTFTFLRALPDHGNDEGISPEQIGNTWLNYLIEKKTILWWGGLGASSEHTAYLRLKHGLKAPASGSIATNGPIVAEQIGAQIFIDGWAMVNPGDPDRAASMARRAASVSHDGEAIYGAQVLVGMEAEAFVSTDINHLIDTGLRQIPANSTIYRMIGDLRDWHARDGDWHKTYQRIVEHYGYRDYIGGCHMVPNHALIILGLLYGEGDFQKSLMVVNTCGWDTDCNSGNLGCLMGLRNGLAGFESVPGVDWRGPVADRLYLPTADGGRCVTDAVSEAYAIVNVGRALAGEAPLAPKDGARFHFELPGSLQGVRVETSGDCSPNATINNVAGHSRKGTRSLALAYSCVGGEGVVRAMAPTFIAPEDLKMQGYELMASPTLYPGQVVHAGVMADEANREAVEARLFVAYYDARDKPAHLLGPASMITPGAYQMLSWRVPDLQEAEPAGLVIYAVGVQLARPGLDVIQSEGCVYLDDLGWEGAPKVSFRRPNGASSGWDDARLWRAAWVNGIEQWEHSGDFNLIQNEGRGLIITGTREWHDYTVSARVTPALVKTCGVAARTQGLTRFYALELVVGGKARLFKAYEGDDRILAEVDFPWALWGSYDLRLEVKGSHIKGWVDGKLLLNADDRALTGGGIALVVEEGHMLASDIAVTG